jgi:hypothetical protein
MPADHSVGLDEHQGIRPLRPQMPKRYPKQTIHAVQRWSRLFAFEDDELLAKSGCLQNEIVAGDEIGREISENGNNEHDHHSNSTRPASNSLIWFRY